MSSPSLRAQNSRAAQAGDIAESLKAKLSHRSQLSRADFSESTLDILCTKLRASHCFSLNRRSLIQQWPRQSETHLLRAFSADGDAIPRPCFQ